VNICNCGRKLPHCPFCGSINKQPLVELSATFTERLKTHVFVYRCRRCGITYGLITAQAEFITDNGTIQCQAPPKASHMSPEIDAETQALIDAAKVLPKGYGITKLDELSKPPTTTQSEAKDEPIPEGWTRDAEGKIVAPISIDDLLKPQGTKGEGNQ